MTLTRLALQPTGREPGAAERTNLTVCPPEREWSSCNSKDVESLKEKRKYLASLKIFTMINWNLLRDPNCIAIAIGNSFVFNSVLSYISQYVAIATEKGLTLEECAKNYRMQYISNHQIVVFTTGEWG